MTIKDLSIEDETVIQGWAIQGSTDPGIQGSRLDPLGIQDPGIHKFEKGGSGSRDPGDPGIQINLGDPGIQGIQGSSRWIPDPEIKSHKSDFK